jgi:hypothetical protein
MEPTGALPKLIAEGVAVRCSPEPDPGVADAGEVSAMMSEKQKKKDEQNPEIPVHCGPKFFTTRPHDAERQLRGRGDEKPLRPG